MSLMGSIEPIIHGKSYSQIEAECSCKITSNSIGLHGHEAGGLVYKTGRKVGDQRLRERFVSAP